MTTLMMRVSHAQRWMGVLGYKATGNTRTILGETCNDFSSPQLMGSTACITEDGITLRMEMSMGPEMSSVQTATEVKRSYPDNKEGYNIPEVAQCVAPAAMLNMDMEQMQET